MKILTGKDISSRLQQLFSTAEDVDLITAYLTSGIFNILAEKEILNKNINLFVRGNKKDFYSGASDIAVFEKLYQLGVTCFLVKDLHSKVYIFDQKTALVGSANLTNKGLGFASHSNNIECLCEYDISNESYLEFLSMTKGVIPVDENILNLMCSSLDSKGTDEQCEEWDFLISPKAVEKLTINDLPLYDLNSTTNATNSFEHDCYVLGLDENLESFRTKFKKSNLYLYLLNILDESEEHQIYFGQFTKRIHNDLLAESDISRWEVKQYIINIFTYLKMLNLDNIKIDRPNYSERIYLLLT